MTAISGDARKQRAEIRIGTSGWSYPSGLGTWNGLFYPSPRPSRFDELGYYAEHFDTVEVNSTFYRMPEAAQTTRWIGRTPPNFEFSIKLFQKFTHPDMYLARGGTADWEVSREDIDLFRAGIDPLARAGKLGALLIQFPPSFHYGSEALGYLDWLLEAFAAYAPAVELRHSTWSGHAKQVESVLAERHAAWVFIDEPKFPSSITQPMAAAVDAAPFAYMRLHGRNAAKWWNHAEAEERYDYLYSATELEPFAARAKAEVAAKRKVYLYLNNHFSAKAVANAAVLRHQTGQEVIGEYGLAFRMAYGVPDGLER